MSRWLPPASASVKRSWNRASSARWRVVNSIIPVSEMLPIRPIGASSIVSVTSMRSATCLRLARRYSSLFMRRFSCRGGGLRVGRGRLAAERAQGADDRAPGPVHDRAALRLHQRDVAALKLACQPRQGVIAGALAAVVHEQAMVGDGAVPGHAATCLVALLVDGELEPGAVGHAFETVVPGLFLRAQRRLLRDRLDLGLTAAAGILSETGA